MASRGATQLSDLGALGFKNRLRHGVFQQPLDITAALHIFLSWSDRIRAAQSGLSQRAPGTDRKSVV